MAADEITAALVAIRQGRPEAVGELLALVRAMRQIVVDDSRPRRSQKGGQRPTRGPGWPGRCSNASWGPH